MMNRAPRHQALLLAGLLAGALGLAPALAPAPACARVDQVVDFPLAPLDFHANTTQNIVEALASRHYVTAELDDALSSQVLDAYIQDLDPSRSYFLASDVAQFENYRHQLDESLRKGNLQPAFIIFNRYHQRVIARFEQVISRLNAGLGTFDFTVDEEILIDREAAPWAATPAELDDLWRRRLKDAILGLKLAGKEPADIQELLLKRYKNRLARAKQTNSEDVFQLYMNAFTKTYDPHTQYFSPRTSENFNINMSLSLEGIGAVLQREDEYTKVVSLVPAGPADKAGDLRPGDKIIAVGQGEEGELVDVIGWRLDEVVQLIRGRKGTVVRLDIIPAASDVGQPKVIRITRNKVELEEQSAKSEVLEIEQFGHVKRIGVISIPTFYVDFRAQQDGRRDYKSTTRDVRLLLEAMQAEALAGVVIDLRNNGGGSLQEAKTMTGLFIDRGPTVQVRSKSNRVDILDDRDPSVVYDGPLAILVNRLSASASEIFAGAIQDYERGLVIGSQTFGKGTVQSLLPLNRGQLKMTQAKFYRISGESTQHRGIVPDILFPPSYDPESIGESTLEGPLGWDRIPAANYRVKRNVKQLLPEVRSLHQARVAADPDFAYLREAYAYRKARAETKTLTLNEAQRIADKDAREAFWLALENKKRLAKGQAALASLDELDEEDEDTLAAAGTNDAATEGAAPSQAPDAGDSQPADNGSAKPATGSAASGSAGGAQPAPLGGAAGQVISGAGDLPEAESRAAREEEERDPYLVEAGQILLDLISLEAMTAEDRLKVGGR